MTANRKRKRLIKERMDRTGEPYSIARKAIEKEYEATKAAGEGK